jgi:hypothetical protein
VKAKVLELHKKIVEEQERAEEATESPCEDNFKANGETILALIVNTQTYR